MSLLAALSEVCQESEEEAQDEEAPQQMKLMRDGEAEEAVHLLMQRFRDECFELARSGEISHQLLFPDCFTPQGLGFKSLFMKLIRAEMSKSCGENGGAEIVNNGVLLHATWSRAATKPKRRRVAQQHATEKCAAQSDASQKCSD
eukprot:CAMPEP_0171083662 /NCGR_PEP_ID=MMETSP0766_2-20121228/17850_1 /TAXON_ID=439317 /ORGANISM="Gambierdiscus australes, Strain CAWD 149" /LENGTH=144 /DNA_ID=CAMNT_0011541105 /DNA_START=24 /DNA_END=458 /DNA_ORIENTATION=+